MSLFMMLNTENFKVRRMIGTTLRQGKNMMTMALEDFNRLTAALASTLVSFVDILTQRNPEIHGHSPIPREFHIGKFSDRKGFIHTLPYPASPRPAEHCQTQPNLIAPRPYRKGIPHHAISGHAKHHLALLRHTQSRITPPGHALATEQDFTLPYLVPPNRNMPRPTVDCLTPPCPMLPSHTLASLVDLEPHHRKSTKLGAKVTDTHRLACEDKHIMNKLRLNLIIDNLNRKLKFPTRGERRADSNDSSSLNDDRSHVQVQSLVRVGIQFPGDCDTVQNLVRRHEHRSPEQIFVRLAAFTSNLEVHSSLDHRPFKVGGGLIDIAVRCLVEIVAPLLRVILRARRLCGALAHIGQLWNGEPVLHQRCNTSNLNLDRKHCCSFLGTKNRPLSRVSLLRTEPARQGRLDNHIVCKTKAAPVLSSLIVPCTLDLVKGNICQ